MTLSPDSDARSVPKISAPIEPDRRRTSKPFPAMTTAFATAMSLPQFNTARLVLPTATRWQASKRKLKRRHFKEIDIRECPLWVKSRHLHCDKPCPLYPRKRTCAAHLLMSAL